VPITTGTTNVVKQAAAEAQFPAGSTIKAILIKVGAAGTYDNTYATPYPGAGSMADEVPTGNGYTAGGQTLAGRTAGVASGIGYVDYSDVVWTAVGALSAIGCAFWDVTLSRWAGFIDFGGTKTATDGAFTVQVPGDGGSGLARIS